MHSIKHVFVKVELGFDYWGAVEYLHCTIKLLVARLQRV